MLRVGDVLELLPQRLPRRTERACPLYVRRCGGSTDSSRLRSPEQRPAQHPPDRRRAATREVVIGTIDELLCRPDRRVPTVDPAMNDVALWILQRWRRAQYPLLSR